jgi:hypothetical protein
MDRDEFLKENLPTWWGRYGEGAREFLPVAEMLLRKEKKETVNSLFGGTKKGQQQLPLINDLQWKLGAQHERWEFNPLGLITTIMQPKGDIDTPRFHIQWNPLRFDLAADPTTKIILQPNEHGDPVLEMFFKVRSSPDAEAERNQRIFNSMCMIFLKNTCMINDLRGGWAPEYQQLKLTLRIEIRFKERKEILETEEKLANEFDRWYYFPDSAPPNQPSRGRLILQALRGWVLTGSKEIGGEPFYFVCHDEDEPFTDPWEFALESRRGREDFGTITWSWGDFQIQDTGDDVLVKLGGDKKKFKKLDRPRPKTFYEFWNLLPYYEDIDQLEKWWSASLVERLRYPPPPLYTLGRASGMFYPLVREGEFLDRLGETGDEFKVLKVEAGAWYKSNLWDKIKSAQGRRLKLFGGLSGLFGITVNPRAVVEEKENNNKEGVVQTNTTPSSFPSVKSLLGWLFTTGEDDDVVTDGLLRTGGPNGPGDPGAPLTLERMLFEEYNILSEKEKKLTREEFNLYYARTPPVFKLVVQFLLHPYMRGVEPLHLEGLLRTGAGWRERRDGEKGDDRWIYDENYNPPGSKYKRGISASATAAAATTVAMGAATALVSSSIPTAEASPLFLGMTPPGSAVGNAMVLMGYDFPIGLQAAVAETSNWIQEYGTIQDYNFVSTLVAAGAALVVAAGGYYAMSRSDNGGMVNTNSSRVKVEDQTSITEARASAPKEEVRAPASDDSEEEESFSDSDEGAGSVASRPVSPFRVASPTPPSEDNVFQDTSLRTRTTDDGGKDNKNNESNLDLERELQDGSMVKPQQSTQDDFARATDMLSKCVDYRYRVYVAQDAISKMCKGAQSINENALRNVSDSDEEYYKATKTKNSIVNGRMGNYETFVRLEGYMKKILALAEATERMREDAMRRCQREGNDQTETVKKEVVVGKLNPQFKIDTPDPLKGGGGGKIPEEKIQTPPVSPQNGGRIPTPPPPPPPLPKLGERAKQLMREKPCSPELKRLLVQMGKEQNKGEEWMKFLQRVWGEWEKE